MSIIVPISLVCGKWNSTWPTAYFLPYRMHRRNDCS